MYKNRFYNTNKAAILISTTTSTTKTNNNNNTFHEHYYQLMLLSVKTATQQLFIKKSYFHFQKGNTALHIASLAGHEEIVKMLVAKGAKVNVQAQVGHDLQG